MTFSLREARPDDAEFLTRMLVEAADWQHEDTGDPARRDRTLAEAKVARYVQDWPRRGDLGVIAQDAAAQPIGAGWLRLFTAAEPAFGFLDVGTPELAIGLVKTWRGRGIGRNLLRELLGRAAAAGFTRVSLSVDHANPATGLYRSEGFVVVESRDTAATMVVDLGPPPRGGDPVA